MCEWFMQTYGDWSYTHKDIPSVIDYQGKDYPRCIREEDEKYVVINGGLCPKSVRRFCPEVAGFNAGTYEVPACML